MPLTPEARDLVIRTLLGEAGNEPQEGQFAVANVIKNRLNSGAWGPTNRLGPVINAPKQFTLWNPGNAAGTMAKSVSANDPRYQRAGAVADAVFNNQVGDNTGGATHYYAPSGMPGGQPPDWARNQQGRQIGSQIFFRLPLTASNTAGTAVTSPSTVGQGQQPAAAPPLDAFGGNKPLANQAVSNALASAKTMLGKNEVPDHTELMQYLHDGGQDLDPHKVAWCAAFVSASLQKAGLPVPTQVVKDSAFGPGAYAPNYLTYGSAVDPKNIQAGDILVNNNGSHVGFAEGPVRMGPNGPEAQMIAGNDRDTSGQYAPGSYTNPTTGAVANRAQVGMVGETWVPLSQYSARRYEPTGAPVASAATSATNAPYFIGDSIADGLKTAANGQGDTLVGRSPAAVLQAINNATPGQLAGRKIVLSTGLSNDPADMASVQAQFDALKAKGVNPADIQVVGLGSKFDQLNPILRAAAAKNGVSFGGGFAAGPDGVHPADYGATLKSLNLGGQPTAVASAAAPAANVAAPAAQPV
jgi:hypothetical protein